MIKTFCLSFLTITEHTKVIPRGFSDYPRKENGREYDLATDQQVQSYSLLQPRAYTWRFPLAD